MTTDAPTTEQKESGAEFRAKFEATLAERDAYRDLAVQNVIAQFGYVKPEDLRDVAPNELVDKAREINDLRAQEREALLREELTKRGIDLEALSTADPAAEAADRVASLGAVNGVPTALPDPAAQAAPGRDRIRAALAAQRKS